LVRPVTAAVVVAPCVMANISPGLAMTSYPMMAEPPSLAGASQATTAEPSPGIAVTPVGTPGGVVVVASSRGVAVVASSGGVVVASSRGVVVASSRGVVVASSRGVVVASSRGVAVVVV